MIDYVFYDEPNVNHLEIEPGIEPTSFAPDAPSGKSICRISTEYTGQSGQDFGVCELSQGEENPIPQKPVAVISAPTTVFAQQEFFISGEESYDTDGEVVEWLWDFDGHNYTSEKFNYRIDVPGN